MVIIARPLHLRLPSSVAILKKANIHNSEVIFSENDINSVLQYFFKVTSSSKEIITRIIESKLLEEVCKTISINVKIKFY